MLSHVINTVQVSELVGQLIWTEKHRAAELTKSGRHGFEGMYHGKLLFLVLMIVRVTAQQPNKKECA